MKNLIAPLLLVMIFLSACNTDNRTELEKKLIGQWESLSINVEINKEGAAPRTLDVPKSKWEEKLKIQPIVTTYNADSTYTSVYKSLEGKVITTNKGTWMVKNDLLHLKQVEPKKSSFKYTVEFSGDSALFKGDIAWDLDGIQDDKYQGWQIKVATDDK